MIEETLAKAIVAMGEYQDCLIGPDGQIVWTTPWQHNLIVEGLRKVLAALVKGDAEYGSPLTYWAVGRGDAAWDAKPNEIPSDAERSSWTMLKNEVARKSLSGQIAYVGDTLSQLQINIEFTAEDVEAGESNQNRQLREFGLFAGGSDSPNTGILINHRVHPRIDLETGFTLQRTLRLTF